MGKLENKLGVTVKLLDSGVSPKDVELLHKSLSEMQGSPAANILKSQMPEIHVVGNSFPKIGYKDYHIDLPQNKIIVWHPEGDKTSIEKKIQDSLSRSALASIINKVSVENKLSEAKPNTNENKPISGDVLRQREVASNTTKDKMKLGIKKALIDASKDMWDNKAHLPPAIKRRMVKNPKGGVSPQALSLLHKLIGRRMVEKTGDPRLIINKALREAKTPEAKSLYNKFLPLVTRIVNWGHRI